MSKNIDADVLKAEIEKRKNICKGIFERDSDTYYQGKAVAYQETLSFINSLQQEQPAKDLEEEIKRYIPRDQCPVPDLMEAVARHFYELGQQAKKEE